eukprot:TRINITY_DN1911_c0_g1_i3.p1 TRINITY_DN1911_c0_g1~~TRINITY_DN1911_c0_g1_i3.p1  ORF type:complete len:135 (-),score=13.67 TRINITY_DN1911_c0_g1_i3:3-407(-)
MDLLIQNVALNQVPGSKCAGMKLDWTDSDSIQNVLVAYPNKFDVIIGSDVVFWQVNIIPLLNTVKALIAPKGKFILCYQSRATQSDAYLLQKSEEIGFTHTSVSLSNFITNTDELELKKHVMLLVFQLNDSVQT